MSWYNGIAEHSSLRDFIRLIVQDNKIDLFHISNGIVRNLKSYTLREKNDLHGYLNKYSSIPIDIVIANNSMTCRSIDSRKLNNSELKELSKNILDEKKSFVNMVLFESKKQYNRSNVNISELNLSPIISIILKELFQLRNSIASISSFPLWIQASYFKMFPDDEKKFEISLFVIDLEKSWEMIAVSNNKILCYRQGSKDKSDLRMETEATLSELKMPLENIAIYHINKELYESFSFVSPVDMELTSSFGEMKITRQPRNLNYAIKIACLASFFGILVNTSIDIIKILQFNNGITSAELTLTSVDPDLLDEIAIWKDLDVNDCVSHIDFRGLIEKNSKDKAKKLRNASIELNDGEDPKVITIEDDDND